MRGHYATVAAQLRASLRPPALPPERDWSTTLDDPELGAVRLRGRLSQVPGATAVVLLVHGLGGSPDSYYCRAAAESAHALGLASLRLGLRGTDGAGDDSYHAGLSDDIHAAVASPELAGFDDLLVLAFSMGGNTALLFATQTRDTRVRAVAGVSALVDMRRSQDHMDAPRAWPYRRHLLAGLKRLYLPTAARGRAPTDPARVLRIRHFRDWDELVVVPRFGFRDMAHYHAVASAGPYLGELRVPALVIASRRDPILPPETLKPYLDAAADCVESVWLDSGGHVGFARDLDLGFGPRRGVTGQALSWLLQHRSPTRRAEPARGR